MKKLTKTEENALTNEVTGTRLIIEFEYSSSITLPLKEGITILDALGKAEKYENRYNEDPKITPMTKDIVNTHMLSETEYKKIKMAQLLEIKMEDLP